LSEDALFIYTKEKPMVIGHESLAAFIQTHTSRPCIIKIHRDLLFAPKNTDDEVCKLPEHFRKSLNQIFYYYTPLVIGYGGNDGSLMGFLDSLDHIEGGIYWFSRGEASDLSQPIQQLLEKKDGITIKIPGFDELMIQMGNKLGLERLDKKLVEIAEKRSEKYRDDLEKLTKKENTTDETKQALSDIASRGDNKDWLYYAMKASKEKNIDKKEAIYKEGINALPESPELHGSYAIFLSDIRKDYDAAETFYKKAIQLDPEDPDYTGNYAIFLSDIRKDYDTAETFYKKAIELDPDHAIHTGNYANFLTDIRKNYDMAGTLYKKAIELDPDNAIYTGNYAFFLKDIRKDYDAAETFYKKAIELDPEDPYYTGNYANFLSDIRKDYDAAEAFYKKAIELNPDDANKTGNYAKCLIVKNQLPNAADLIKKAFKLNQVANIQPLELELWFYRYAVFFKEITDAREKVITLLDNGITSPGWYLDDVIKVAERLNHPDIEDLSRLAERISSEITRQ
nr:tetratricopeptide repeat protein [Desulfobacteraceae bacterium]